MDLAREVSFAGAVGDEGGTVSCGFSLEEAIRGALLEQVSLKRLDAPITLPVSIKAFVSRCLRRKHLNPARKPMFTPGNMKSKCWKRHTLAIVTVERLSSYPLGMTCQPYNRCGAACPCFSGCLRSPGADSPGRSAGNPAILIL